MKQIDFKATLFLIVAICTGLYSFGQTNNLEKYKKTQTKKSIDEIDVIITEYKMLVASPDIPYCKADIDIFKNGIKIDSIHFSEIEAVGGHYGLLFYKEIIKNHIIISKFGDYDGKTIIINKQGQQFITIGGDSFVDMESGLLFSIYYSDLAGFSVFDLNQDKEVFKTVDIKYRPRAFYKYANNRFLLKAEDDKTNMESFWEIEFEKNSIKPSSLTAKDIEGKHLKALSDSKEIYIDCE